MEVIMKLKMKFENIIPEQSAVRRYQFRPEILITPGNANAKLKSSPLESACCGKNKWLEVNFH